jgi:hypothetical protein
MMKSDNTQEPETNAERALLGLPLLVVVKQPSVSCFNCFRNGEPVILIGKLADGIFQVESVTAGIPSIHTAISVRVLP